MRLYSKSSLNNADCESKLTINLFRDSKETRVFPPGNSLYNPAGFGEIPTDALFAPNVKALSSNPEVFETTDGGAAVDVINNAKE